MLSLAFYGKGGIGKSTTCTNVAVALARMGHTVLHIGCDPKADSVRAHFHGEAIVPLLRLLHTNPNLPLEEAIRTSEEGIVCVETGGPTPGLGCAGRGIGMVLEYLARTQAVQKLGIDCVLYDVLGDVVCGGFSMPMRKGFARHVAIVSSGEAMALYAMENIAKAISNFKSRGYASLAGIIAIERGDATIRPLAQQALEAAAAKLETPILATIPQSPLVFAAEGQHSPLLTCYPESPEAAVYRDLAKTLFERFGN